MKLISISAAAKLLGVDTSYLRRHETADGKWVEIYGHRIRVHRMSPAPRGQRRYDENDIIRVLARLKRGDR